MPFSGEFRADCLAPDRRGSDTSRRGDPTGRRPDFDRSTGGSFPPPPARVARRCGGGVGQGEVKPHGQPEAAQGHRHRHVKNVERAVLHGRERPLRLTPGAELGDLVQRRLRRRNAKGPRPTISRLTAAALRRFRRHVVTPLRGLRGLPRTVCPSASACAWGRSGRRGRRPTGGAGRWPGCGQPGPRRRGRRRR